MANKSIEEQEAESTVQVKDVPWKEEQQSAAKWLHKGDRVHARLELPPQEDGTETMPLVTEFVITGVNGARVYGSVHHPEGMSQKDGWRFELVRTHEALPEQVSEISAEMRTGVTLTLMGKGTTWVRSDNGTTVDVEDIVTFTVL